MQRRLMSAQTGPLLLELLKFGRAQADFGRALAETVEFGPSGSDQVRDRPALARNRRDSTRCRSMFARDRSNSTDVVPEWVKVGPGSPEFGPPGGQNRTHPGTRSEQPSATLAKRRIWRGQGQLYGELGQTSLEKLRHRLLRQIRRHEHEPSSASGARSAWRRRSRPLGVRTSPTARPGTAALCARIAR